MRVGMRLRPGHDVGDSWPNVVDYVLQGEELGCAAVWAPEAWNHDAVTALAYLASITRRMQLGAAVLQVGSRSPALIGTTALSLAEMSGDRFVLGLGTSGPQVMEGWHGVAFRRPLTRLRETVEIVRMVTGGDRVVYAGVHHQVPLPGGEGKALRTALAPRRVPIHLAALGPRSLALAGEIADGWLGTQFVPEEHAVYLDPIRQGAADVGRVLDDFEIQVALHAQLTDDANAAHRTVRQSIAFSVGAMGSAPTNFYSRVLARAGYERDVERIREHWSVGRRDLAAEAVPDELAARVSLIGDETAIEGRMRALIDAGVTAINVNPLDTSIDRRVATLDAVIAAAERCGAGAST